jgi:hypothetical protein
VSSGVRSCCNLVQWFKIEDKLFSLAVGNLVFGNLFISFVLFLLSFCPLAWFKLSRKKYQSNPLALRELRSLSYLPDFIFVSSISDMLGVRTLLSMYGIRIHVRWETETGILSWRLLIHS